MRIEQRYILGVLVILIAAFAGAILLRGDDNTEGDQSQETPVNSEESSEEQIEAGGEVSHGSEEEHANLAGCWDFSEGHLTAGEHTMHVALADTKEERAQGLSGCEELPENAGLYFDFDPSAEATFWMKDMLIPIDIIWITDGKVVGVEANVPAEPEKAESELTRYPSPGAVDAVLELEAGKAAELGISEGTDVSL